MQLTKELIEEALKKCDAYHGAVTAPVSVDVVRAMARQLLASMEQEPVAYIDPFTFKNFATYRAGETDNKRMGREWVWANPDAGLIPLYAAPQLPQPAVPDEWRMMCGEWRDETVSIHDASGLIVSGISPNAAGIIIEAHNACRAAMLQGAEPMQGWIPCSERMPEEIGRYWCYVEEQNSLGKSHYQWNCSWNGDRWWVESENGGRVTHWQPLSAAPQQEVK